MVIFEHVLKLLCDILKIGEVEFLLLARCLNLRLSYAIMLLV